MSTLSQIREIEQAIQDAEQLYNVLRVFPRDITIGEFEDTIKETLPKEDISVGEGIQQAYSIKQTVQQQMAQAISDLKKYYPGSYFDLIKPYRDPSVSNSFRLAVPQLKHGHYETFEEKLPWLIDVIGRTDPAILEDLKHALKEVVKPPSSKAKAKYDAWVELMEDDRFRRLLAMFGLLYYPTPEEAPPLEDIKRSMETTDYMLEQAKRVTSILSIFKSKRKVQNIKERILANTPADKSKTVEESMNLIEKKIMPELLSERQQLVNQLMREHVESFLEENPVADRKAPRAQGEPAAHTELSRAQGEVHGDTPGAFLKDQEPQEG